jgi:8-oxo-dGTP diphosphatase
MAQKKPIQAAGGVVVRKGKRPLVAVVQRAKDDRWVLPRGKLKRTERARAGAKREVIEETGHRVDLHEYLGAITYRAQGRPKVVEFWHMRAAANPSRDLMPDIARVAWLPFKDAVKRLTYPLEKLFLKSVGADLVRKPKRKAMKERAAKARAKNKRTKR